MSPQEQRGGWPGEEEGREEKDCKVGGHTLLGFRGHRVAVDCNPESPGASPGPGTQMTAAWTAAKGASAWEDPRSLSETPPSYYYQPITSPGFPWGPAPCYRGGQWARAFQQANGRRRVSGLVPGPPQATGRGFGSGGSPAAGECRLGFRPRVPGSGLEGEVLATLAFCICFMLLYLGGDHTLQCSGVTLGSPFRDQNLRVQLDRTLLSGSCKSLSLPWSKEGRSTCLGRCRCLWGAGFRGAILTQDPFF